MAALVFGGLCAAQAPGDSVARFDLRQGIPLVHVSIDGQGPFTFVLDTGTNCEAILSPRVVARLGLSLKGRKRITDLAGQSTRVLDEVDLDRISLARLEFRGVRAVVTDLPDGDSVLDGILGFGLFRDKLLTLDYPHRRLMVEDGSLAGRPGAHVLPMKMPDGIPLVEISLAGKTQPAAVDTGALGLSIPASMASTVRFMGSVETVAYGRTQVSAFELRGAVLNGTIDLAGFRFEDPWLEINPVFSVANLGSGSLRDFSITFDQRSKLVQFSAASQLHIIPRPRNPESAVRAEELIGTVFTKEVY
jgi:predicted aspartyl protease